MIQDQSVLTLKMTQVTDVSVLMIKQEDFASLVRSFSETQLDQIGLSDNFQRSHNVLFCGNKIT